MKKRKTFIYVFIAFILVVASLGMIYKLGLSDQSAASIEKLPDIGEKLYGYTVEERGYVDDLSAETMTLKHEKSGATVLFVINDDENRTFNMTYRTYYTDESDVNHALEHSVLASSAKYPSKDLYFDLSNKTYNTYLNACTMYTNTQYMASSQSEVQLKKIADAYLSCMTVPSVLENGNIFKREALRYELTDQDSPIMLAGTVLGEDGGRVTSIANSAVNHVLDALYPNQIASNALGKAADQYQSLRYDHMKKAFETYYHFDNALITVYGDTNYRDLLSFMDSEYLSKAENTHTDFSSYRNEPEEPGHVDSIQYVPAYIGDTVEGASQIDYAISVSKYSWKDRLKIDFFTELLNNEASPLNRRLREAGINDKIECSIYCDMLKPCVTFTLSDTDVSYKDAFKRIVHSALEEIKNNGFDKEVLEAVLRHEEFNNDLIRENADTGVNVSELIGVYWSDTGRTDYYEQMQTAHSELAADTDQNWIRTVAGELLAPLRSALVASVPKPGLAEERLKKQEQYLSDWKASMSEAEIETLIQETRDFQAWNASKEKGVNLAIEIDKLPDPEETKEISVEQPGEIAYYTYPLDMNHVGYYRIDFDISNVKKEDLYYLLLYTRLIGDLDTRQYDSRKARMLFDRYLNDFSVEYTYIPLEDEKAGRASVGFSWTGMCEDYEISLETLLELTRNTKFNDRESMIRLLEQQLPTYDDAKNTSPLNLSVSLALSQTKKSIAFQAYMKNQDGYLFLKDELEKLKNDEDYVWVLEKKLHEIANMIMKKDRMRVFVAVAPEQTAFIRDTSDQILNELPSIGLQKCFYHDIFVRSSKTGIIVESPDQANALAAELGIAPEFNGKYLPFLSYINDKLIVPKIRFENGAYSSSGQYIPGTGTLLLWSTNDTNITETYDVYHDIPDFLRHSSMTQDDLDSYIINMYGDLTCPQGKIEWAKTLYSRMLNGVDTHRVNETIKQIKDTTVGDEQDAADIFERALAQSISVTVGNEGVLREYKGFFDELLNYKNSDI